MDNSLPLPSSLVPAVTSPEGASRPSRLLLPILIVLLPLLPPETRGESMAGASALIALLALLRRPAAGDGPRALLLAMALFSAAWASLYPVPAAEPLAVALLAGAAGVHAAALPRDFRWSWAVPVSLSAVGSVVSLHAIAQKLWGLEALREQVLALPGIPDRDAVLERLGEGRAFAAFPTPAALGGFLAIALPVTVAYALRSGRRARIALLVAAALETAGLVCAASATAAGALLGALVLAGASRNVSRRLLVAGVASLLLVVVAIAAMRGGEVLDLGHPGSPWGLRAGNFRAAWEMARDHPWTGVGPGGFGGALPGHLRAGDNETRYAHDLPLQLAAETGLPAALVLSIVFFVLFLGPLLSRRGEAGPTWLAGARIGLAAFALQNLADFTAFLPSLLWLAALLRGTVGESGGNEEREPIPVGAAVRWPILVGVAVAACVAGLSGLGWNARVTSRELLAAGDLGASVTSARRAVALAPWDTEAGVVLTQALLARRAPSAGGSRQDLRDALAAADRAVSLEPGRPGARDARARARLALGDLPGAYADLVEASRLYPLRTEYAHRRDGLVAALPGGAQQRGSP
jgi:O-antigen ligase